MIPNIDYYRREHIVLNFEGDMRDGTPAKVFDQLNLDKSTPNYIDHLQDVYGFAHRVTYFFKESISCPSGERLEVLLNQANFVGNAAIKKGEQEVWGKAFERRMPLASDSLTAN